MSWTVIWLVLLAEAANDGSLTLPATAWGSIAAAIVAAIVWLAKGRESDRALLLALTREMLTAANTQTAALEKLAALLERVERQTGRP